MLVMFQRGKRTPRYPICVLGDMAQYIVGQNFTEVYDDEWLINIEGKTSVRTLTRIPVKKVRVSDGKIAFDYSIIRLTI
ncbi:phage repressor protein CI [Serratia proteamaculans]|uniref:phage repressor protein CI n=2 Tax=Serratia proteamaculans TaxID=28151 RepID=UPI003967A7D6